jgi:exopolysaccharide biosynthesis polyprenyl glycosylphosphotransferase
MKQASSHHTVRRLTIATDILLINLAFVFSYLVRYQFEWLMEAAFVDVPYSAYVGQQILLNAILIATFSQNNAWARRRGEFWLDEVSRAGYATIVGIALMMAITFLFRPLAFSRLLLLWTIVFTILFIALARLLRRVILTVLYQRGSGTDQAIVVGSGEVGRGVIRTLLARPDLGFQTIGYLDDATGENNIGLGRIPHLGCWQELPNVLRQHPNLHTVFIALPSELHMQIGYMVRLCQGFAVQARVVPDLLQLSLNRVEFNNMAGIPMLSVRDVRLSRSGQIVKRAVDFGTVLLLAPAALLISGIIALAIKLDSAGPVLFAQERIGQNGRPFPMIKFRSMVVNADDQKQALQEMNDASGPIFKIRNDPRLTRAGRLLRRFSLDELPQLYNVFVGDMSLVGPRPPLAEEVGCYQPWHRQRLEIKGGMTGLWQVSGRSDLTFDEQCLLDIYYIENWSLALDVRILLQTLPYTLFGRGAY